MASKYGTSFPGPISETADGSIIIRPHGSGEVVIMTGDGIERAKIAADGTPSGAFGAGSGGVAQSYVDDGDAATLASAEAYTDANSSQRGVAWVASADATATEKARADFVCDGTDDHVEIHQAMADIGTNGGKIELFGGNFNGGQIVVQNRIWVAGQGMRATTYKLKSGVNTDAWINYVSPDGIVSNAEFIKISDLCIDANKAQQTAGNGVYLNSNPSATKATNDTDFDPHYFLFNVEILNAFQDGFAQNSRSETRLFNVYSELAGRYGFNPSYDTFIVGCVSAHSGSDGFYLQSSSIRLTACKAFYSGAVTPTSGNGFTMKSTHGVSLTACEAQDNKNIGFLLDTSTGCIISGCTADSNSTRGVGSAPAVDLWAAKNNIVQVSAGERKADGTNSYQQSALRLRTTCTGNDITMTHSAFGSATVGSVLQSGSDTTTGNRVYVNSVAV